MKRCKVAQFQPTGSFNCLTFQRKNTLIGFKYFFLYEAFVAMTNIVCVIILFVVRSTDNYFFRDNLYV